MITPALKAAFRFHMQNRFRAYGDIRPYAEIALAKARADLEDGKARYPSPMRPYPAVTWQPGQPGLAYVEKPESVGLRLVGRVMPECGGRNGYWDKSGKTGWFTDPFGDVFKDGTGLCWGVVYQLPGRNGESRFVAGYQMGGTDGGPTLDLSRVYVGAAQFGDYYTTKPQDDESAIDAAREADDMARRAAEDEREYQTAWHAGARYADESADLQKARAEIKGILAERRQVKGQSGYPALCKAVTTRVRDLLADMRDARENMAKLAAGDYPDLIFWPGSATLAMAFNEAAGDDVIKG